MWRTEPYKFLATDLHIFTGTPACRNHLQMNGNHLACRSPPRAGTSNAEQKTCHGFPFSDTSPHRMKLRICGYRCMDQERVVPGCNQASLWRDQCVRLDHPAKTSISDIEEHRHLRVHGERTFHAIRNPFYTRPIPFGLQRKIHAGRGRPRNTLECRCRRQTAC
jgi:hypothetical protein